MSGNLLKKRVYGAVIIKSKLANYNADFTGNPRTLPDGTIYATDKVLKFKIRDYLEKKGEQIFVKTKYKRDGNPMTLEEIYKYHFNEDAKDKLPVLKNLLSMFDVRLFGATFAKSGDSKLNLSIHGPVQISYAVNRFTEMKDSGMFTDQIGSQYASKEGDAQTTLGSQTRSFEAHYVHHFSINPENLEHFIKQILIEKLSDDYTITKKESKKEELDKDGINKKIEPLENKEVKQEIKSKLDDNDITIEQWKSFVKEKINSHFQEFVKGNNEYQFNLLSEGDIPLLKKALQVAVTHYDSTSKKDAENELLLWIELNENTDVVLRNFSELIKITKEDDKNKIDLTDVFKYLENYKNCFDKIEIYYDETFTEVSGIPADNWRMDNKEIIKVCKSLREDCKKDNNGEGEKSEDETLKK